MQSTNRNIVIAGVVVLAVIALGVILIGRGKTNVPSGKPASGVEVLRADLSPTSSSKLLPGFPSSIPVEKENITDSYKADYTKHGVIQYTVNFTSSRTKDALWNEYVNFLKNNNYSVDPGVTSKAQGYIKGTKGNTEFNAVIFDQGNQSYFLTLNYIVRK